MMKMLKFACTMRNGKEQICEATKYLRRLWWRSYCRLKFSVFFFLSWNAFHSSHVTSGAFQLC